ncbi:MAG: hypothetical protein C4320_02910, partial [Armatimonadota bacterium]
GKDDTARGNGIPERDLRARVSRSPVAAALARLLAIPRRATLGIAALQADRRQRERMQTTIADRVDDVRRAYVSYEELVEAVLNASNYGPDDSHQTAYFHAAFALKRDYPKIRPYLMAYLRMSPSDAAYSLAQWGKGADPFEILFQHDHVADLLESDDGEMISRIHRTREALTLYNEHLRSLASSGSRPA